MIAPPQGQSKEVAPEYYEDEEEPWVYYQPEPSPILETDKPLESSESTSHRVWGSLRLGQISITEEHNGASRTNNAE